MPEFLEKKLKKQYGKDSDIPYAIMNRMGVMRGSKITAKGRKMEREHITQHNQHRPKKHVRGKKRENPNRYQPTGLIRGLGGERFRAADKSKVRKGPTFASALNRS